MMMMTTTMKLAGSCGTSMNFCQTVRCVHFPRDGNFHFHRLNLNVPVDYYVALVKVVMERQQVYIYLLTYSMEQSPS